jgi:hypothetical protein
MARTPRVPVYNALHFAFGSLLGTSLCCLLYSSAVIDVHVRMGEWVWQRASFDGEEAVKEEGGLVLVRGTAVHTHLYGMQYCHLPCSL